MTITHKSNHRETALAHLESMFDASTVVQKLLNVGTVETQELEDVVFSLISERTLESAQGANLDQIGKIVGEPRDGLDDKTYRKFVKIRIRANRSNGNAIEITAIVAEIVEPISGVLYIPLYPAGLGLDWLVAEHTAADLRTRLLRILSDITPAGVKLADAKEAVPGYWGFEGDGDALPLGEGSWTTEMIISG